MSTVQLFAYGSIGLLTIGLYAFFRHANLIRKLLALNIMSNGVFLLFIALANRTPGTAPDPVPLAMVLTGIVVAVSATALGLSLIRRYHRSTGSLELPKPGAGDTIDDA